MIFNKFPSILLDFLERPKHFKSDAVHTLGPLWLELLEQKCRDIACLGTPLTQPAAWNRLAKVDLDTFIPLCAFSVNNRLSNISLIALKIHITAEMNDELASIGGFKTEHRGLIDVKVSLLVLLFYTSLKTQIDKKNTFHAQNKSNPINRHFRMWHLEQNRAIVFSPTSHAVCD